MYNKALTEMMKVATEQGLTADTLVMTEEMSRDWKSTVGEALPEDFEGLSPEILGMLKIIIYPLPENHLVLQEGEHVKGQVIWDGEKAAYAGIPKNPTDPVDVLNDMIYDKFVSCAKMEDGERVALIVITEACKPAMMKVWEKIYTPYGGYQLHIVPTEGYIISFAGQSTDTLALMDILDPEVVEELCKRISTED